MTNKKLESVLSMIEIAENNLKNAKLILAQISGDKLPRTTSTIEMRPPSMGRSNDEDRALEVVEGYFDGENMLGDNSQTYLVPPNYASKTQLVVGDRMKWILTPEREVFKLIQPAARERIVGTFSIEGENFVVLVDKFPTPIKLLKASATFAMKNLGLQVGDEVAILIPKDATPTWGAFSSIIKAQPENSYGDTSATSQTQTNSVLADLDVLNEFKLDDINLTNSEQDYF